MTQEIYTVHAGKGPRPRPYKATKWAENYDRIFKKKKTSPQKPKKNDR